MSRALCFKRLNIIVFVSEFFFWPPSPEQTHFFCEGYPKFHNAGKLHSFHDTKSYIHRIKLPYRLIIAEDVQKNSIIIAYSITML
jgi:hypothetical protein